jgi:hypothetical protein
MLLVVYCGLHIVSFNVEYENAFHNVTEAGYLRLTTNKDMYLIFRIAYGSSLDIVYDII